MKSFSFSNPDSTVQVLDFDSMLPVGSNTANIRGYGISLAEQYSEICDQICSAANKLYHEHFNDHPKDLISPSNAVERIGIMLGQQIHGHMLRGEEAGDIWAEVCERLAARATGSKKSSFCITIGDSTDGTGTVQVTETGSSQMVTASIPMEYITCRNIILPGGVCFGIHDDTAPSDFVSEDEKAAELSVGRMIAQSLIDDHPSILAGRDCEQVLEEISNLYLKAWLKRTDLDLSDYWTE